MTFDELTREQAEEVYAIMHGDTESEYTFENGPSIGIASYEPFDELFQVNNEKWVTDTYTIERTWHYNDTDSMSRFMTNFEITINGGS